MAGETTIRPDGGGDGGVDGTVSGGGGVGVGAGKLTFSLAVRGRGAGRPSLRATPQVASSFGDPDADGPSADGSNPDLPRPPLVIPPQRDSRRSLLEQAEARRGRDNAADGEATTSTAATDADTAAPEGGDPRSAEDRAAIRALTRDAAAAAASGSKNSDRDAFGGTSSMVIRSTGDTFQREGDAHPDGDTKEQFQEELEQLPEDLPVQSHVYRDVPIAEFGAAMLRGMGWSGSTDAGGNSSNNGNRRNGRASAVQDPTPMPRPSRLGLGATPKLLLDGGNPPATHGQRRPPRRHDQVQREERLKQQQEEYARERQKQLTMDKQHTMQVGSIVDVAAGSGADHGEHGGGDSGRRRRAVIRKLQGVPGLNMILVQFEGQSTTSKVKKGSVRLMERSELDESPFEEVRLEEAAAPRDDARGDRDRREDDRAVERPSGKSAGRSSDRKRREGDRDGRRDRDRDSDRNRGGNHRERTRDDGGGGGGGRKRRRDGKTEAAASSSSAKASRSGDAHDRVTWVIPNIRVRVVSSKYGESLYRQKGVVVDVTRQGVATLTMGHNGQVIHAPERHLETALPKVGGNACILTGKHRLAKGRLLERDSKANVGAVQVFEDMNVVTASLDDMAEWCGPLDDDLDHHF